MRATSDDKAEDCPRPRLRAWRGLRRLAWAARGRERWHAPAWPLSPALHPGGLLATVVLATNDWLLKPSALDAAVTGKLSDVAGMIIAPLWLATALSWVTTLNRRVVAFSIASVVVMFVAIKTSLPAARAMESALAIATKLAGLATPRIVVDASDLIALPAVLIAWWIARDDMARVRLGALRDVKRWLHRHDDNAARPPHAAAATARKAGLAHALGASTIIACGARRDDVERLVDAIAAARDGGPEAVAQIEASLEKLARL